MRDAQDSNGHGIRDLFHRVGTAEHAATEARVLSSELRRDLEDHEVRLRTLEHLTAKVVGGSILGGSIVSVVAWFLQYLK